MKKHSYYTGEDEHREFTPRPVLLALLALLLFCFAGTVGVLFLIKWLGAWLFYAAIVIVLIWSVYVTFKGLNNE